MRKNNQKNADVTNANLAMVATGDELPSATVTPIRGKPVDRLAVVSTERSAIAAAKMALLGTVRQQLAEAADLFAAGASKAELAREVANKAAIGLYQGRVDGSVNQDEVSAILGDQFGYKTKKDGSPSKTPQGEGEAIRKRVVRAAFANDYVTTGDGGRFFEGLPKDEIEAVCNAVSNGETSIWSAYEQFATIKREHSARVDAAFDPKRMAAIVASLTTDGAAEIVLNSPALVAVYAALRDAINVIAETPADETEAA